MDAARLLAACALAEDHYDLIDIDSFGSDTSFLGSALEAVKFGGLLYLTATDGMSSGGRTPTRALAAFGCHTRSLPFSNEVGLRMLAGAAVKEGAARGLVVTPVFSLYSHHGPVFRVMLRVRRSAEWPAAHYAFVGHCHVHGGAQVVPWSQLGHTVCRCGARQQDTKSRPAALAVAGPMWTGPLHSLSDLEEMAMEAQRLGWAGRGVEGHAVRSKKSNAPWRLEELLQVLVSEADPRLPPGFLPMDALGRFVTPHPPRAALIDSLRAAGFAASRTHLDQKAIMTDASIQQVAEVALASIRGIRRRTDWPWKLP